MLGGRSERIEYHLLHAFTEADYICPDKEYRDSIQNKDGKNHSKKKKKGGAGDTEVHKVEEGDDENRNPEDDHVVEEENEAMVHEDVAPPTKNTGGKRKPAYSGGLVLEPKRGTKHIPKCSEQVFSIYDVYEICWDVVEQH